MTTQATSTPLTLPGLDALRAGHFPDLLQLLRTHPVALLTNQTGLSLDGTTTLQVLRELGVEVKTLFSPEHGPAGLLEGHIESSRTGDGLPIHSLYGATRRPTEAMLEGIGAVVCDLQDVGARFYTYASTMTYIMEECARYGIAVVVFDRPNPIGDDLEGPFVHNQCQSFVGHLRIPIRHGMTMGELAEYHRAEQKLDLELQIAEVVGWKRTMRWPQTGLPWRVPSPNLPDYISAAWYPGACLLEFSGVSVGRGTEAPFQIIGAPWMSPELVLETMHSWPVELREEIDATPLVFTPTRATHEGQTCRGIRLRAQNRTNEPTRPVALGMALLSTLHHVHPAEFNDAQLDRSIKLLGSPPVLESLRRGDIDGAIAQADADAAQFAEMRKPYLIY